MNVVRNQEQADVLRAIGARYVVNSASPSFTGELDDAIAETRATLAFDAISGGHMAATLLARADGYSRYGSPVHKQVYLYGSLDPTATEIRRSFGMAWGIGGWLMTWFIDKSGRSRPLGFVSALRLSSRRSSPAISRAEISLAQALSVDTIRAYARRATGEKYAINPSLSGR
ncbi:MAG TPA: hypothetical protein VH279_09930 [Solirubrobacteraceae bacterium]|nr:hypothetical protein [Solirubrobacteraceae bacterium]